MFGVTEAFGVKGMEHGVILTPFILLPLCQDIQMEWVRKGEGRESDLQWLREFLQKQIRQSEGSSSFQEFSGMGGDVAPPSVTAELWRGQPVAAAGLCNSSELPGGGCTFCGGWYASEKCLGF